jgi:acetoin utilization protein AcuB
MNRDVISVAPHESVVQAIEIMQEHNIRHLPVLDNGDKIEGILSDRDTRQVLAILQVMGITLEQARGDLKVSEFMTTQVKTISPDTDATEAAQTMLNDKIDCLLVTENNNLSGILTDSDILAKFVQIYSS